MGPGCPSASIILMFYRAGSAVGVPGHAGLQMERPGMRLLQAPAEMRMSLCSLECLGQFDVPEALPQVTLRPVVTRKQAYLGKRRLLVQHIGHTGPQFEPAPH